MADVAKAEGTDEEAPTTATTPQEDMSLLSITDGENERGIPFVKFIDDVEAFAITFTPPATAELLIGAYSELHAKFKTFDASLTQKSTFTPDIIVFQCHTQYTRRWLQRTFFKGQFCNAFYSPPTRCCCSL
jgi:hypothetical protein